ncbi:hypothetical protein NL676_020919 [Syzygium grande]|nr:hypothetical protein NL676_020919 [Syzygium grande]
MSGLVVGRAVAALAAPVLLSAIAYKHLHKKKTSNYDVFLSFCDEDAPLAQMMECKNDSSRHIVLPIFYRVERHGIDDLGRKVEDDRKRRAVIEVSCLKGWESEKVANGDEGQLVKLVVRKVLIELKKALELLITENSVGIKSPVNDIMEFLDNNHGSTLYVGIYGEDGIENHVNATVLNTYRIS